MKRVQHERVHYKKCAVRRKAAAKKGTMKRVKQKRGQKWKSKTKKVQHENSVTWRTHKKLHREKSTTQKSATRNKCNTKKV